MTPGIAAATVGLLTGAALTIGREGMARAASDRRFHLIEDRVPPHSGLDRAQSAPSQLRKTGVGRISAGEWWLALLAGPAGFLGLKLAGPAGLVLGVVAGIAAPRLVMGRRHRKRAADIERQLGDVVETCALAVRAGLSIAQALDFAANEAEAPMNELLGAALDEQVVGVPFESALKRFGDAIATEDARLFVLVISTHARSGGNLAGALDEVVSAIRHRIEVRRELRALSAQGRVSGAILGSLPIAFFLVMATTSHRELGPVYRSGAGIAMVFVGLLMEALAYLWIRRLIRVQV
jgi:tight adherence protein B